VRKIADMVQNRSVMLFFAAGLSCAGAAAIWLLVGEPWRIFGDASHYISLYNGGMAPAPYGYRILTPFLAQLLAWGAVTSFGVITLSCLVLTAGVLALYMTPSDQVLAGTVLSTIFWVTSYPFAYYATTLVRADGPMLLMIAIVIFLSRRHVSPLTLFVVIAIGALAHETMLICIPALWIDKLLSGDLTGGKNYKYAHLFFISLAALAFVIGIRLIIPVLPATKSYMTGPAGMISYVLNYSGGWFKHLLRIYASFGPALFFALCFATPWRSPRTFAGFFALFMIAVAATFLATDTLRVMAIIYFPVVVYAAKYVAELWRFGRQKAAVTCIFLQMGYSYVVYGHLRSFDSSALLKNIAALLSLIALVACLVNALRAGFQRTA
jgi:hypothetical protein